METNSIARNLHRPSVFVDANTLISGLFFEGHESTILKMGILGIINISTCNFVIAEVREVIKRKFSEVESNFDNILTAITVLDTEKDDIARALVRDKKDIPILATVLKYKPDYFVTGDNDFHTPEIKRLVNVVRAQDFLKEFL